MVLGLSLSLALSIVASVLAGVFVLLEQWRGKKPFRSWRLWLALGLLLISPAASLLESLSTARSDRERQADLKLIQRLESGLNSLCFEINLQAPNPKYREGCSFQLETSVPVADLRTTGFFANYLHIRYNPDSGWYRGQTQGIEWPGIVLDYDPSKSTLRFAMSPFGAMWKDQLAWKAERLADLSQVRMGISLSYGEDWRTWHSAPDTSWLPVKSISLFANDYQPENLVAILTPRQRSYAAYHNGVYFHPVWQPVKDTDDFRFNVDLLAMRSEILESLAKE